MQNLQFHALMYSDKSHKSMVFFKDMSHDHSIEQLHL